jgi:hypothetical protein
MERYPYFMVSGPLLLIGIISFGLTKRREYPILLKKISPQRASTGFPRYILGLRFLEILTRKYQNPHLRPKYLLFAVLPPFLTVFKYEISEK